MSQRTKRLVDIGPKFNRDAVVLVTSATDGVRDCGTGFCVHHDPKTGNSFVVTCAHVADNLANGTGDYRVNGSRARIDQNGSDLGVDLAVLVVSDIILPVLQLRDDEHCAQDFPVHGLGYMQLSGGQYVTVDFFGTIDRSITFRRQLTQRSVPGFRMKAKEGESRFVPGNSGSPVCDERGKVIGVLAFASREGLDGYVLSSRAVVELFPAVGSKPLRRRAAVGSTDEGTAGAPLSRALEHRPPPPPLGEVKDSNDLQKGRFGGSPSSGPVKLSLDLVGRPRANFFVFDARVESIDRDIKLVGPARFFLHDTFPRSLIEIRRNDEDGALVLRGVSSYGMFTLGCQVYCSDGQWRQLEFDLLPWAKKVGLSKKLQSR